MSVRKISVGTAAISEAILEYSVIVRDILNYEGEAIGEIYGVDISGMGDFAEALDLTTYKDRIFTFVEVLRRNSVTPSTLGDVVYDSLPL